MCRQGGVKNYLDMLFGWPVIASPCSYDLKLQPYLSISGETYEHQVQSNKHETTSGANILNILHLLIKFQRANNLAGMEVNKHMEYFIQIWLQTIAHIACNKLKQKTKTLLD